MGKYGAKKVSPDASKEQKQRYVVDKYEKLSFASGKCPAPSREDSRMDTQLVKGEADKSKPEAKQPQLVVRKAEPAAAPGSQQVATQCVQKSATAPMACAADISDSWFDDFFKDESCAVKPAMTATASKADGGLDAFLDATLHAPVKASPVATSAYPAHLDPFRKVQTAPVADPFLDWPEF